MVLGRIFISQIGVGQAKQRSAVLFAQINSDVALMATLVLIVMPGPCEGHRVWRVDLGHGAADGIAVTIGIHHDGIPRPDTAEIKIAFWNRHAFGSPPFCQVFRLGDECKHAIDVSV